MGIGIGYASSENEQEMRSSRFHIHVLGENYDGGDLVPLEHTILEGGASCMVVQGQDQDIEEMVAVEVAHWVAHFVPPVIGQLLAYQCEFSQCQTSWEVHSGEIQSRGHVVGDY